MLPPRATSGSPPRPVGWTGPVRRRRTPMTIEEACAGMISRPVSVRPADVVFVKGLIEASEGLANVFAERGGELVLAAPESRAAELDRFIGDLGREIDLRVGPHAVVEAM